MATIYETGDCWSLVNKKTGKLVSHKDTEYANSNVPVVCFSRGDARETKKWCVNNPKEWKVVKLYATYTEV